MRPFLELNRSPKTYNVDAYSPNPPPRIYDFCSSYWIHDRLSAADGTGEQGWQCEKFSLTKWHTFAALSGKYIHLRILRVLNWNSILVQVFCVVICTSI